MPYYDAPQLGFTKLTILHGPIGGGVEEALEQANRENKAAAPAPDPEKDAEGQMQDAFAAIRLAVEAGKPALIVGAVKASKDLLLAYPNEHHVLGMPSLSDHTEMMDAKGTRPDNWEEDRERFITDPEYFDVVQVSDLIEWVKDSYVQPGPFTREFDPKRGA